MILEIIKYCGLLLMLSLVMIFEHAVSLPFITCTVFLLIIRDQQSVMVVVTVGLTSLIGSTVFGVGWLMFFILLAVSAQIVRYWKQMINRVWWGSRLVSLGLTVIFSILIKPTFSTYFLIFSLLSMVFSLLLVWLFEIRKMRRG